MHRRMLPTGGWALRRGGQSPSSPGRQGTRQDALEGHPAAAEPWAGRRGHRWASARHPEGHTSSSDVLPASSGTGCLSRNMDARMLLPIQDVVPIQDVPCNRSLFLLFPGTYPGGGKKGGSSPGDKVEGRS